MKILVLNGSPKGKYSFTLFTALYIEKFHPEHEFHYLNASEKIKDYANDFSEAKKELEWAELILVATPVYSYVVPSQLHHFFVLMKESGIDFSNKYASLITTSKHFYDVTAHTFVKENLQDMKMKFVKGLSADMQDLLSEKGQKDALDYFEYLMWCIKEGITEVSNKVYAKPKHKKVTVPKEKADVTMDKTIAIVADLSEEDTQLKSMIDSFVNKIGCNTRLINIHNFPFENGCTNCFDCTCTGVCSHKDGFVELLRDEVQTCDGIVNAFSIKEHSTGYIFKTYEDRQFVNGHRSVTMGMPFGYLISGNLSEENNLKTILDARLQCGGNFPVGTVTDEFNPDEEMDMMVKNMRYALEKEYIQPANFYGVGGGKIFRDLVWQMRGMMKLDYKFFKEHGQLDFPQNDPGMVLKGYLAGLLVMNPEFKAKLGEGFSQGMVQSYQKVVDEANKH